MRGTGLRWLWQTAMLSAPRLPRPPRIWRVVPWLSVALVVAGCVVSGCAAALSDGPAARVGFGVSIAALAVALLTVGVARAHRDGFDAAAAGAVALLAGWTVVATAWTLPADAGRWISFADGLGWIALALAMLVHRGITDERVVHVLEVRELHPR